MEISKALKDAENALRDFVEYSLQRSNGQDWWEKDIVSKEKVSHWKKEKLKAEEENGAANENEILLYYAPFDDITEIVLSHWEGNFEAAFKDKAIFESYLKILKLYRDPDIQRRELLVYQKHLLLGVTGEIRNRIIAYRSRLETGKEGYPRIEYIKDNLGNIWVPGKPMRVKTNMNLRPGDQLEFLVQASDPQEMTIEYRIHGFRWQTGNVLFLTIEDRHVQKHAQVHITIRSKRKFHAYPLGYDDRIVFQYQILPRE